MSVDLQESFDAKPQQQGLGIHNAAFAPRKTGSSGADGGRGAASETAQEDLGLLVPPGVDKASPSPAPLDQALLEKVAAIKNRVSETVE